MGAFLSSLKPLCILSERHNKKLLIFIYTRISFLVIEAYNGKRKTKIWREADKHKKMSAPLFFEEIKDRKNVSAKMLE